MNQSHDEPEDAGEGYFASISDLMVGILFVFLLMLVVFAINYANEDKDKEIARLTKLVEELTLDRDNLRTLLSEKDIQFAGLTAERDRLKNGVAELVNQLEGVSLGLRGEQGRLEGVRRSLLYSLQRELDKRGVKVEVDAGQGILRLSSDGLFLLNEDKFTGKGRDNAEALLEEMARLLPCDSTIPTNAVVCDKHRPIFETVLIEGHTDTSPTGRAGGNWTLSTDRARAILEMMVGPIAGLRDLRNSDDQPLLGLAGYGDSRPLPGISGADERNRRIEVRFLLSGQHENLAERIQRLDGLLTNLRSLVETKP